MVWPAKITPVAAVSQRSQQATLVGFFISLLILTVIVVISCRSIEDAQHQEQWIVHTYAVVDRLDELFARVREAEADDRAFIITGNDQFLQSFGAARAAIPVSLQDLRTMTADNLRQQQDLNTIAPLVQSRLLLLDQFIASSRSPLPKENPATLLLEGSKLTENIRQLINGMKAEEATLLEARVHEADVTYHKALTLIVIGSSTGLVVLLVAFRLLRHEVRRTGAALQQTQDYAEEVEALYESAPCGYHSLDKDGLIVRMNSTELEWLGYTREEVVGRIKYFELLTPKSAELFHTHTFPLFMQQGWIRDVEYGLRRKDGSVIQVLINAVAVYNKAGNFLMSRSTLYDITERKRGEQKMNEANAFLESVIENIPLMLFVKDAEQLRFVRFNRAGEYILGYRRDELIGKNDHDFFPRAQADFFVDKDRETLARGTLVEIGQEPIRTRSGEIRILHTRKIPVLDANGKPLYLLGIAEDITARRRTELELVQVNEDLRQRSLQLESANKELESFTYSVSHDLRTPLRAIAGYSQILKEDYHGLLDEEGRRLLTVICDNTSRMNTLINDLLEFSRLKRASMTVIAIDMTPMVRQVFTEISKLDAGHIPELVLHALPPAFGDPVLLRQVWTNLLTNAIKFSGKREHPVIEVSGKDEGTETIYCVKDNGAGFDMQYYNKLFGVFQRLHTNEQFPGTGVGLAIVQRVVTRHGGRVWAEGRLDGGAEFYFTLPSREDNHA